ncbi:Gfo/Idh/MocA family oxidoreductase [Herbiconiux sp. VKM Ac-2851]|uniref:Gfo/Idh/MocA family oxidoreductase n=1 Tax=Herbiconiux sp. VKM Ac-2851 TaxID=2739025 RepID=UPI001566BD28|nr:Gfo/Idh/MocA family oxidoreductase [Herbiconiux sp. VKM Ac-2851]NQX36742.1 Gfo/Idh/MocA family oxidoreductase [Herbiconiux sp. VKM Ac-2851]
MTAAPPADAPREPVIGVVGAGFHATTNILPALGLAGVPLAALATRSEAGSRAALARFGSDGAAYDSVEALLAHPGLDGVIVVAQPADQLAITHRAVAAGVPVFVDKPLGLTAAEARTVARAADESGAGVQVGFMKRHAPVYRQLRTLIADGSLGTVRSFSVQFGCDSTPFCRTEAEFVTLAAIHLIDLARFLFGEVATVHAVNSGAGAHVALSVTLGFASGVAGTLELTGLPSRATEVESVRVLGDTGFAETTDARTLRLHRTAAAPADLVPPVAPAAPAATASATPATAAAPPAAGPAWGTLAEADVVLHPAESAMSGIGRDLHLRGFVGELRAFADAVAAGTLSPDGAWDNVATMDLCDRILASSAANRAARPTADDVAALVPLVFGEPGAFRDEMVARIRSGRKTGSSTLAAAYPLTGTPVPQVGERRVLVDSDGRPAAVVEYLEVTETTLVAITPELARHESSSVDAWRAAHRDYFETLTDPIRAHLADPTWTLTDETPVIATVFRAIPL